MIISIIDKYKNLKKGATLLELLVVMTIFMLLLGLGYSVVINFKTTVEFESAAQEFESILQSLENRARNNVVKNITTSQNILDFQDDGYMIYINYPAGLIHYYTCKFDSFSRTYTCSQEGSERKVYSSTAFSTGTNICNGIYFDTFTGDMKIFTGSIINPIPEQRVFEGLCDMKLFHSKDPNKYFNNYHFNSSENIYEKD